METGDKDPNGALNRAASFSQASESSQTAQEFIASQLSLEADAREVLPYQFDSCTKPLGPLRQSVYACLTCSPPPATPHQQFTPAGVCYSCSISCHGEHNLVELFTKRNFVCDCGTTRLANSGTSCNLRTSTQTGKKGGVTNEEARKGNRYNQNFEGKFCGCGEEYDPEKEKGTMFQCLGLGTVEDGGCGEDWWHPECLMGLPHQKPHHESKTESNGNLETVEEESDDHAGGKDENEVAKTEEDVAPPGFPNEDDFDHVICYKCTGAFPWIKQYAGTTGFLPALFADGRVHQSNGHKSNGPAPASPSTSDSRKRKAEEDLEDSQEGKRAKSDVKISQPEPHTNGHSAARHEGLSSPPTAPISLFVKEDFRDNLCRCPACFPRLVKHPQLLEEEESYEPPLSESSGAGHEGSVAGRSVNSGSLLDRGEAALSSMDRVRAIEGAMAYNHLRDKLKGFLQPFAESGQAVSAEDIKEYFTKLRGDEQAMRDAAAGASADGVQGDGRKEQDGY